MSFIKSLVAGLQTSLGKLEELRLKLIFDWKKVTGMNGFNVVFKEGGCFFIVKKTSVKVNWCL